MVYERHTEDLKCDELYSARSERISHLFLEQMCTEAAAQELHW